MKGSDISAHLTLSAKQGSAGKIVKLPLPEKKKNSDKVVKPPAKLRRGNLWYALYLPQLAELDDTNQTQILNTLANLIISVCLLYTSPSPRDRTRSRMPSSA